MEPAVAFVFLGLLDSLNPFAKLADDMNLLLMAFKIVILLYIVQFARNRFGGGTIVTIIVIGLGYVMLFTSYFAIFGPVMFIYLFIAFGFISLLFDLSIAKPWQDRSAKGGEEDASTSYHEKQGQHEKISNMRRGIYG